MKRASLTVVLALLTMTVFAGAPINTRTLPGTTSSSEAIVYWDRSADYQDIMSYNVYVDGEKVGVSKSNNFRVTGLAPERKYEVRVGAVNKRGKEQMGKSASIRSAKLGKEINVRDYGAKGDGKSLDTKSIQKAIDDCEPFGEVVIPAGEYLTGALFILKSNISLRIEKEATLKAVNNLGHFPLVKSRYEGWGVDIYASVLNIGKLEGYERHSNIRIYGGGVIDNQGSILANQQTKMLSRMARSRGLPIVNCDDVALDNITVQNPCTWNIHPLLCNGITTYECNIVSSGYGLSNADGWNPDSSKNCYILHSVFDGQDDNIAIKTVGYQDENGVWRGQSSENIYVNFCHFIRGGGLCIGVEMQSDVRNVQFTDCVVENSDRGFMICSRHQGPGDVEDVLFRDIVVESTGDWGINVTMWYWIHDYMPGSFRADDVRGMRNIRFENIEIKKSLGNPIQVIGLAEKPIEGVTFKNIKIAEAQYDVLLRHCRDVKFENVQLGERYWVLDNAEGISVDKKTSKPRKMDYQHKMADSDATYRTKALYANLHKVSESGKFLFGAQDATSSGYGWHDDSGVSDIQRASGEAPAFYSWDFMHIARPDIDEGLLRDNQKVRRLTCQAFYDGGVNSYCWHAMNPVTGGSFYDTSVKVVPQILPGGEYHHKFIEMLDQIVEFNKTLIGKNGEQVPIIFRPWHEFDGDWFWWGRNGCTAEEFKELFRFTVSYLRDTRGVRNFIYAFSPDINFTNREEYLLRYPGDEYVDIVAMDNYWDFRIDEKNIDLAHMRLKVLSDYAKSTGKIAALSETGQGAIDDPKWFTERLLHSIYGYPGEQVNLAYVAVWRNSTMGFFTPYKGHPAMEDFLDFIRDDRVVLGSRRDWLGRFYHLAD